MFDLDPLVPDDAVLRSAVLLLRDRLAELGCAIWVNATRIIPRSSSTRPIVAAGFSSTRGGTNSATFAPAYAVRPKPNAPVSAPCMCEEIESGRAGPQSFTLRAMRQRLDTHGDVWGRWPQSPSPFVGDIRECDRRLTPTPPTDASPSDTLR